MRASLMGMALAGGLAWVAPAAAQSSLDGPLSSPAAVLAPPANPAHSKRTKPKKAHHAAARSAVPKPAADADDALPPPTRVPTAAAAPSAPREPADDPLSLGMKWNGNNDNAAQTRSQNLDGNAVGTGAEVGMKLHF